MLLVAVAACGGHRRPIPPAPPPVPAAETAFRLLLIGDGGAPHEGFEPVLAALAADVRRAPDRSLTVFLGDNIYPRGLPDSASPERAEAERRLLDQVAAVRDAGGRAVFVPGNHDWDKQGAEGWDRVLGSERLIADHGAGQASQLPAGGCPGPVVRDVEGLRLIFLDTQWWLHGGHRPVDPASSCAADSDAEVTDALRAALESAGGRHVVVMAHHPFLSGGIHGGNFGVLEHVFPLRELNSALWIPLPIIGSLYPVARRSGISNQDLSGSRNREMRDSLAAAFAVHRPLVYASGHDHDLQVHAGTAVAHVLVSGSGIYGHTTRVGWTPTTRFARRAAGYMRLDVTAGHRVRLSVVVVDADGTGREVYGAWLN